MIASTARAKPLPCESVNSGSTGSSGITGASGSGGGGSGEGPRSRCVRWRASAGATTVSDTIGAAAMPSATAAWPSATPTVTASANRKRDTDSISTSPP